MLGTESKALYILSMCSTSGIHPASSFTIFWGIYICWTEGHSCFSSWSLDSLATISETIFVLWAYSAPYTLCSLGLYVDFFLFKSLPIILSMLEVSTTLYMALASNTSLAQIFHVRYKCITIQFAFWTFNKNMDSSSEQIQSWSYHLPFFLPPMASISFQR